MPVEQKHGMVVAEHLGGYIPGGDVHSWYPHLWEWLVKDCGVRSVLDVGCGDGVALREFSRLGAQGIGVDGVPQDDERILVHDYTTGPWPTPGSWFAIEEHPGFDLVWSCEFVEHVEERFIPNFLSSFLMSDLVLMTHAVPGQGGWHHVNCRDGTYWIAQLDGIGYEVDAKVTSKTRELAALNGQDVNYYRDTGIAFRRA